MPFKVYQKCSSVASIIFACTRSASEVAFSKYHPIHFSFSISFWISIYIYLGILCLHSTEGFERRKGEECGVTVLIEDKENAFCSLYIIRQFSLEVLNIL